MASIKEMIAIVQTYIHIRKDVEVNIVIEHPVDIIKLKEAYDIAIAWMTENNVKLKLN